MKYIGTVGNFSEEQSLNDHVIIDSLGFKLSIFNIIILSHCIIFVFSILFLKKQRYNNDFKCRGGVGGVTVCRIMQC